jgi:hypothetical protein
LAYQKTVSARETKMEAITEFPYATDFNPPQIPQTYGTIPPGAITPVAPVPTPVPTPPPTPAPQPDKKPSGDQGENGPAGQVAPMSHPWPYTPVTPTTFETKHLGLEITSHPTLSENHELVDFHATLATVSFVRWEPMNPSKEVLQPQFLRRSSSIYTELTVGKPCFVGTLAGGELEAASRKTWLIYVTATVDTIPPPNLNPVAPDSSMTVEVFSLPATDAHSIARKASSDKDVYKALEQALEAKTAVLEEYCVQSLRAGRKAENADYLEIPYPTDYEPPQIPQHFDPAQCPHGDFPHTSITPITYEIKNCGFHVEAECHRLNSNEIAELTITPSRIQFQEWQTQPYPESKQPIFNAQRITTMVDAEPGKPNFLGTMGPIPANALDASKPSDFSKQRVWFAFVTLQE